MNIGNFYQHPMRSLAVAFLIVLAACDDGGPAGADFVGRWDGNVPQGAMWIYLTVDNGAADGFGVINATTGGMAIDATGTVSGARLTITVRRTVTDAFVANLTGELRGDTINGTWNSVPVTLVRD